jgi:RimJ/RimL family protein N-acetyltransferase
MNDRKKDSISTERLLLRPFAKSDREAVLDLYSDNETMRYWSKEPIMSLEEADSLIEQEIEWPSKEKCFNWAVAQPDSNLLIGKICLFHLSERNRRAEIGYLLNRRFWGRGYMTEALTFVLRFAFDEQGMHRMEADTDPENLASLALLERFGFVREGLFHDRWYVHGKWHDSVMLGLLASKYRAATPNPHK